MNRNINLKLVILLLALPTLGISQELITGMVADSAALKPLPNVNVQVKNRGHGTISDNRGYFKIQAADWDTLLFSMVGYRSKALPVSRLKLTGVVYLTEDLKLLKPIVIDANILIPGLDKMKVKSSWRNPTMDYPETPGFQGIQTFGPGYVMRGALSRYSKYEKERSKLKKVQLENTKAKVYMEVINSPEVKDKIMKDYSLTEEDYYRLLAIFNEKNKDFMYELEAQELSSLLLIFYAENANKK